MSKIQFDLNRAGVQELLKSDKMAAICESHAQRMTVAAGFPYVSDVHVGVNRVNAAAVTKGVEKRDSRKHH